MAQNPKESLTNDKLEKLRYEVAILVYILSVYGGIIACDSGPTFGGKPYLTQTAGEGMPTQVWGTAAANSTERAKTATAEAPTPIPTITPAQ